MLRKPMVVSVLLGICTFAVIALLGTVLATNRVIGTATDWLALPGAFVASLVYPEGIHTGPDIGAKWALLVMISNLVIYIFCWYFCLATIGWATSRGAHS
jgi:hypothetical protein